MLHENSCMYGVLWKTQWTLVVHLVSTVLLGDMLACGESGCRDMMVVSVGQCNA